MTKQMTGVIGNFRVNYGHDNKQSSCIYSRCRLCVDVPGDIGSVSC